MYRITFFDKSVTTRQFNPISFRACYNANADLMKNNPVKLYMSTKYMSLKFFQKFLSLNES